MRGGTLIMIRLRAVHPVVTFLAESGENAPNETIYSASAISTAILPSAESVSGTQTRR